MSEGQSVKAREGERERASEHVSARLSQHNRSPHSSHCLPLFLPSISSTSIPYCAPAAHQLPRVSERGGMLLQLSLAS